MWQSKIDVTLMQHRTTQCTASSYDATVPIPGSPASVLRSGMRTQQERKRDPLLVEMKEICDNSPYIHVPKVLGFCYCIHRQVQETRLSMPPHEESVHSRLKSLVLLGVSLIVGMLFLPVIWLFLDLPNDTVDIHGFGSMSEVADGLAHCSSSEATVVEMGEAGIMPQLFMEHLAWLNKQHVEIPDFNYLGKKLKRKVSCIC